MAAAGMWEYIWAHGTTSVGILGALKLQKMVKAFPDQWSDSHGFYCMCGNDQTNILLNVEKAWTLGKTGAASHTEPQGRASGVTMEQKTCKEKGIIHGANRWCIKPRLARITSLWMIEEKVTPTTPSTEEEAADH